MLTAYVIASIITAICNFSLAFLVYFKDKKNIVNINYFFLNTSVALWAFGFAMAITASDKTMGLFWIRLLNIGAILIPLFFLHFVFSLIKIYRHKKTSCHFYLYNKLFLSHFKLHAIVHARRSAKNDF